MHSVTGGDILGVDLVDLVDLRDLMESWTLALRSERKAAATLTSYRAGVKGYVAWCAREDVPAVIDRRQVQAWTTALMDGGAEPSTAQNRQLAVRRFSAWLTEEGEQGADPLLGLKPPKLSEKLIEPLTEAELQALLKACQGKEFRDLRDMAVMRLMAETGLRAGEALGLQVGDLDLGAGLVTIRKSKTGRGRVVHIGPKTAQAVDRYLRARRIHKLADRPQVWLGERSQGLGYTGLWNALKRRAAVAGIERFHPHLFRHTAASRWLSAGGSEGGLMAQAGWTQRAMLDRYSRATASARAAEESRELDLGNI